MKLLIVLVACVALVAAGQLNLSDEQKAKVRENASACIQQEGVTKEQAHALREGRFDDADQKVKCFANCFLEKSGLIADGQVKVAEVTAKLGPLVGADKVQEIQAKCDSLKGADKCDTAYQLYKCYHESHAQL